MFENFRKLDQSALELATSLTHGGYTLSDFITKSGLQSAETGDMQTTGLLGRLLDVKAELLRMADYSQEASELAVYINLFTSCLL